MRVNSVNVDPALQAWLGGSRARTADGAPLQVFHGTGGDIEAFADGQMVWVSTTPEIASDYAQMRTEVDGKTGNVLPLHVRVERPFAVPAELDYCEISALLLAAIEQTRAEGRHVDLPSTRGHVERIQARWNRIGFDDSVIAIHEHWSESGAEGVRLLREFFEGLGFDGIQMTEQGAVTYGVFDRAAVKSAISAESYTADPRIRFKRSDPGQATHLSVDEVREELDAFLAEYRGAAALKFVIRPTAGDLYGEQYAQAAGCGKIVGAYHPFERLVAIAAHSLPDRAIARRTFLHEVVGHYGLNCLQAADKRRVLAALTVSANEPSLAPYWRQVERLYPDKSRLIQAEEVFAKLAETAPDDGPLATILDRLAALVAKGLRRAGLLDAPMTAFECRQLVRTMAEGLRDGRLRQQTFPESNQAQFARQQRPRSEPSM